MTKDELLSCLTDRPCEVCKFHTDLGYSKWSCVFEGKTEEWIPCSECERRCNKWENLKTSQE